MQGSPRREDLVDVAIAGAAFVATGLGSIAIAPGYFPGTFPTAVGVAASLVMPAALVWRRRRPAASAATVYAGALAHFVVAPDQFLPVDLIVLAALYAVTAYGSRPARVAGLTGAVVGAALVAVALGTRSGWMGALFTFVFAAGMVLATWALGLMRRARLERIQTLEERARRLELERDQQARLAAAAERARIAREMHDVVAHSLSVVIAQADGGRYAAATDPGAATKALATIADTGRAALADVRRILGVLREGEVAGQRAPQPEHGDIDTLVRTVRASGLPVALIRTGTPRPLPPALGLAAYRIVQEALTNVLKHGGPDAEATVLVQWRPESVVLQVEDNGRGAAAPDDGAGHGLVGMRERAALFGGTVDAGPHPGGGYRVRAEIPVAEIPMAEIPVAEVAGGTMAPDLPRGPDGRPDPYLRTPGAR